MKNYTSTQQQEQDRTAESAPVKEFIPYGMVKRLVNGKAKYLTPEENSALNTKNALNKRKKYRRRLNTT